MLQPIFRKLSTLFYKPILASYLKKTRIYIFKPFKLTILPGVFHPAFFYSTKFLLQYLKQIDFTNKSVIEVGAGNGLIAFSIAQQAKKVVALELSKVALKGLLINEEINSKHLPNNVLQIVESNLFKSIEPAVFDYIVVNPPYYPNSANNDPELAWNCGLHFEYFRYFFSEAIHFMDNKSIIIMVLSSQCNILKIEEIARQNGFQMQQKHTHKFLIEDNFIFEFTKG